MLAAIVVIILFFSVATDGAYISPRNISNLLRQTAITGVLAVGMVFVIISAEIDLSVGSMMGLLGGAAAIFDVWLGWPLPLTIVVTLAAGLVLGAWNGWWVAYCKVPSFIVTLAGMLAFRGILVGITNGTTVSPTSAAMSQIGQSYLPNGIGFGIGFAVMALFVVWQWRQRRRSSKPDGGHSARRHLAAERLPRRADAGADSGSADDGRHLYGDPHGLWPPDLRHRRQHRRGEAVGHQR